MFGKVRKIHFVGIGGIGMSGIAELLLNLGFGVSGSDIRQSPLTDRLSTLGGRIYIGHSAENVLDANVVVVSSAVRADNVELVEARRRQIPVIPRGEMLAELMRLKYSIAIAGAHGKTSTTSMVATVLVHAGYDPTAIIGGRLNALGSNAKLGAGEFIVAEADESDGSFLKLSPTLAVVTSIDREHLDHYGDLAAIQDAFVAFINKVPFYGAAILCLDDANIQAIIPRVERRMITYGTSTQADLVASRVWFEGFGSTFEIRSAKGLLGTVSLCVPGQHSVLNALAAVAVGLELEIPFQKISSALAGFQNADRRFQILGERGGVLVVDDYGHHPTEIAATLTAARRACDRRIVAVFQPHRFTRTAYLEEEFGRAFYDADILVVVPIYPAGEDPIPGITAERLVAQIAKFGHRDVLCAADLAEAEKMLCERLRPGDLLITLGAGDVWKVGERILAALGAPAPKDPKGVERAPAEGKP
ncbi:MAG: UDP-N-acetylmuramate--L-alanine ligase [Acidobacteria bacterium]|nr:UDP-N-acetylmuramate--L-alanine ligase [Acidobacteriota bacterium]